MAKAYIVVDMQLPGMIVFLIIMNAQYVYKCSDLRNLLHFY